jgi:deoxyribose-phosphate aldolase
MTARDIAAKLDHTVLRPDSDEDAIRKGCEVARKYGVACLCVQPGNVVAAARVLAGSTVLPGAAIGFPHGANRTDVKAFEAERALDDGARELDMVLNIGKLKSGDYDYVEKDIRAVAEAAHTRGVILKVILENAYLTDAEKAEGCRIAERAGADFVKTSTGFAPTGATIEDLRLMRASCSERVRLKASGGIRTLDAALACIAAGCARVGTTSTEAIMEEAFRREAEETLGDGPGEAPGGGY